MKSSMLALSVFVVIGSSMMVPHLCQGCDEFACASVVSKCMLTQACKCDIVRGSKDCTCCADCAKCLGQLFERCCDCVELCKPGDVRLDDRDSVVGKIEEGFPELYGAITSQQDSELRWTTYTVSLAEELKDNTIVHMPPLEIPDMPNRPNCTVAFKSQCTSNLKCKKWCSTVGASGYRFFFNGCCECIGSNCLNYGINESRCLECSDVNGEDYDNELIDDPALLNAKDDDQTV